jgi:hypothetical protein
MAAITAGDVSYVSKSVYSDSIAGEPVRRTSIVAVTFAGGADKTYPTNGVPLTSSKLNMAAFVESVVVFDTSAAPDTHLWTYDLTHNTLRAYSAEGTEFSGDFSGAQTLVVQARGF